MRSADRKESEVRSQESEYGWELQSFLVSCLPKKHLRYGCIVAPLFIAPHTYGGQFLVSETANRCHVGTKR